MYKGRWKRQTKTGLRSKLRLAELKIAALEKELWRIYAALQDLLPRTQITHTVAAGPYAQTVQNVYVPSGKAHMRLPPELDIPATPVPETAPAELSDEDNLGEGRWL